MNWHAPEGSLAAARLAAVDTTGWSTEWKMRLANAEPGLSVPADSPRGINERRFLALWDTMGRGLMASNGYTFRQLCDRSAIPNDGWTLEGWVRDLTLDLRRVGSLSYNKADRRWYRTPRGAAVADREAA